LFSSVYLNKTSNPLSICRLMRGARGKGHRKERASERKGIGNLGAPASLEREREPNNKAVRRTGGLFCSAFLS
jgi:hypothetical protein